MAAQAKKAVEAPLSGPMTHLSFCEISDTPWAQPSTVPLPPTEDIIKENFAKHRKEILSSLNPSQLFQIVEEFELDEEFIEQNMTRRQKAELLLSKVENRNAYLALLKNLEQDVEHMGHKYIVSLLRGQKFAKEEEMQESKMLLSEMRKDVGLVIQAINLEALEPHLMEEKLVTSDELETLQKPQTTKQDKAKLLFNLLKTKGPTAHFIFVHRCLAVEEVHGDLYSLLTASGSSRKRKLEGNTSSTKVTKRYPSFLEPPKGITTQSYLQIIGKIRKDHHIGGELWKVAEDAIMEHVNSPNNPLETKIALLLESCNPYIFNRQFEEVFTRVEQAREMCTELYSCDSNAQVLEGRCEWVLSRLYKLKGETDEAIMHTNTAFSLIANCEPGEEMILTSFNHGCLLLNKKERTLGDIKKAITSFKFAISCASQEDFGTRIVQYCKLRLAQAYAGAPSKFTSSSVDQEEMSRVEVPRKNVEEAKRILRELEDEDMHHRTRWSYYVTCSDVFRIDGQTEQAATFADKALEVTQEHKIHEFKFTLAPENKL